MFFKNHPVILCANYGMYLTSSSLLFFIVVSICICVLSGSGLQISGAGFIKAILFCCNN
jgi:hypothetical protein